MLATTDVTLAMDSDLLRAIDEITKDKDAFIIDAVSAAVKARTESWTVDDHWMAGALGGYKADLKLGLPPVAMDIDKQEFLNVPAVSYHAAHTRIDQLYIVFNPLLLPKERAAAEAYVREKVQAHIQAAVERNGEGGN